MLLQKLNSALKNEIGMYQDIFRDFDFLFHETKKYSREDEKNYYIDVALAGMNKDNIKIELENDNIIISSVVNEKNEYASYHQEFKKSLYVDPKDIDISTIESYMRDGILTVVLPKKKEDKKDKINIEIK